jgi:Protein of unknown function (DUF1416)
MAQSAIVGSVTKQGQPLGGAYVRLTGPSGEFVSEQYTKDEGKFTFFVAPGSWTVEIKAAGAETATKTVDVDVAEVPLHVDLS